MRAFRFQSASDPHATLVPATEIELVTKNNKTQEDGKEETVVKEGEGEPTSSEYLRD